MPFTPDKPEVLPVPVATELEADTFHITMLVIRMDPNDETSVTIGVEWKRGAVVDCAFVACDTQQAELSGDAVLSKMMERPSSRATVYEAVKSRVYDLLEAKGHLPEGTIS